MEDLIYKQLLINIGKIDSQFSIYEILGYPENGGESIKSKIQEAIISTFELSMDLEHELDCYYIEKGEDILKRYIKTLGNKALSSLQGILLNHLTPGALKHYYPSVTWTEENADNAPLLFMTTAGGFYIESKRKNSDQELSKDDLVIFYMATLYKVIRALKKAIPETQPGKEDNLSIDNIYNLKTLNEKLLYIKHTGLYDCLKTRLLKNNGEPNKSKIAKTIAHITSENPATIATLLDFLDNPYKEGKNNPYTAISIPVVLNALNDDVKIDVSDLVEIQSKLYPH